MKKFTAIVSLFLIHFFALGQTQAQQNVINEVVKPEPNLSPAELGKVEAREIAYHANANGLLGGRATFFVQAAPKEVFQAATDYEHYAAYIPHCLVMKVLERDEHKAHLYAEYKSTWPYEKIILETENQFDTVNPERLQVGWRAIKTNMKQAVGYWILKPHKDGTLVTYGMEFELAWIPRFVAAPNGKERVLEVAAAVRKRAETAPKPNAGLQTTKK